MDATIDEITALIPHREPFIFIDKITSYNKDTITTEKYIDPKLPAFQGHYPGNPIMPGVLLCEAIFQSGALLMAKRQAETGEELNKVPVLTRIGSAKFKHMVKPGDTVEIKVILTDSISQAHYFKGTLKVAGKTAVQVEFVCAMAPSSNN